MNDIKYEIWLPSTIILTLSFSFGLCSTLTVSTEAVDPAVVELKTFLLADRAVVIWKCRNMSQVDVYCACICF